MYLGNIGAMELSKPFQKAIVEFRDNPEDQNAVYHMESAYWSFIADSIGDSIRDNTDCRAFITEAREIIDYGLCEELLTDYGKVGQAILGDNTAYDYLSIGFVSTYLEKTLHSVLHGDRRQILQNEIKLKQLQKKRVENEISEYRKTRRLLLCPESGTAHGKGATDSPTTQQAKTMESIDRLNLKCIEVRKAGARGTFISAEKKREHAQNQKQLELEQNKTDHYLSGLTDKESVARIRQCSKGITDAIEKRIDILESIDKTEKEIENLEEEQQKISPLEIENRMRSEIDYLKDLIKLSARRLRITPCPLIRNDDVFFTPRELAGCLERIVEFDPAVFKNDRVSIFGKPSVLCVPGNGKALYDWKHNQIIVPIIPHQKNFLASVAAGIIEYRFDVDEDKHLIYSYNQLPEYKTVKSVFQLKQSLSKDYITWMTSEYNGYRVLSREVKKWFDHEIAPSRNDIFTPAEYRQWELPPKEYKRMAGDIETRCQEIDTAGETDLWIGSIFNAQQANSKRAIDMLKALLKKNAAFTMAYYNLGFLCMKEMRKQEALDAFQEFCKRKGQSWWTNLAREHIRHLQMN